VHRNENLSLARAAFRAVSASCNSREKKLRGLTRADPSYLVTLPRSAYAYRAACNRTLKAYAKLPLKLHQTEGRISSNLLKHKQSSRKHASCAAGLKAHQQCSFCFLFLAFAFTFLPLCALFC